MREKDPLPGNTIDILLQHVAIQPKNKGVIENFPSNRTAPIRSDYERHWKIFLREVAVLNFFKERLRDAIVVDLGGGNINNSSMSGLAAECHASGYISVEKYYAGSSHPTIAKALTDMTPEHLRLKQYSDSNEAMEQRVIQGDMLEFLQNLPSDSVSVCINGIDIFVIQDYLYHEMLAAEIYRVCKQDGIIFGINADAISILQASGACKNFLPYCKSEPNGILYKTERTDDFSTISSVIESTRAELEHKKTEQ